MNAIENAIDLVIGSGLFIAPRRVLLDRSAELKQQSPSPKNAGATKEAHHEAA